MAEDSQNKFVDSDTQHVAKVYAQAFLGAAEQAGQVDALVSELNSLVGDVLDEHPDFQRLLESTFISHDDKVGLIDRVLGSQASQPMLAFLKVLSAHDRTRELRAIEGEVEHLYNVRKGRVEVSVQSAVPIDAQATEAIKVRLREVLKREPLLHMAVDPSLLGGIVIRVGDTVFDTSIATQFKQFSAKMLQQTIAEIETRPERFMDGSAA